MNNGRWRGLLPAIVFYQGKHEPYKKYYFIVEIKSENLLMKYAEQLAVETETTKITEI